MREIGDSFSEEALCYGSRERGWWLVENVVGKKGVLFWLFKIGEITVLCLMVIRIIQYQEKDLWNFPGGPVVKAALQCRGHGFHLWLEN